MEKRRFKFKDGKLFLIEGNETIPYPIKKKRRKKNGSS